MTARKKTLEEKLARNAMQVCHTQARLGVLFARQRTRDKSREATRHYRLGLVLESFLFEDAGLLGRVRERIEQESPRVRAAFALEQAVSWFEQPERVDSKTVVDTRRFRLGMVLEGLLVGDGALIARVEGLMREQPTHVRDAFGLEGDGPSWFDRWRIPPGRDPTVMDWEEGRLG